MADEVTVSANVEVMKDQAKQRKRGIYHRYNEETHAPHGYYIMCIH